MQRIIDATAAATLPAPPALSGTAGYFQEGLNLGVASTSVRGWWMNMVQEELMNLIIAGGQTPDTTATNFGQVLAAVQAIAGSAGTQYFAASGTFTAPAGVTEVFVEVWGGGGGSVGAVCSGAGGGYAAGPVSVTPGNTTVVTVGAGGYGSATAHLATAGTTSSFGSALSATGGQAAMVLSTAGGLGVGGAINIQGGGGTYCAGGTTYAPGGSAPRGGPGGTITSGNNPPSQPGGGGGAAAANASAWEAGAAGGVLVRW